MQNDRARHDEYLLDYDQVAANQAIYLVIFHWVVGSLYMSWVILLLSLCRGSWESGIISLVPIHCFLKWKGGGGGISYADPLWLKSGGTCPHQSMAMCIETMHWILNVWQNSLLQRPAKTINYTDVITFGGYRDDSYINVTTRPM